MLAAYLAGQRLSFLITCFLAVSIGIAHPLFRAQLSSYSSHVTPHEFMVMHGSAAVALLGAWVLSMLHGISRDSAQEALERTLNGARLRVAHQCARGHRDERAPHLHERWAWPGSNLQ